MRLWKKLNKQEIQNRVLDALKQNVNFRENTVLGIPASYLDPQVFYADAPFLKDAPYMTSMVQNPNHIGCHTLGESEEYFHGTQQIEKEVIRICAEDILKGDENGHDGFIAAGGTEANIQALWIFRNHFRNHFNAKDSEIVIVCSEDSHYSMNKASNLLGIDLISINVDEELRTIDKNDLELKLDKAHSEGKKYFSVVVNMATTMFGSVDNSEDYINCLKNRNINFKLHVDGAYGGFIYPFTNPENKLNFANPYVSSITLDAHKMAQAPYGTGIFLVRKGLIHNVCTKEAQYVNGMDITLNGSRSGANAIAVWMILMTYGPNNWREKNEIYLRRTDIICEFLSSKNIEYYRHPNMNIVTIKSKYIPKLIVEKYGLVPETHSEGNKWCKIVVMDHVTADVIAKFIEDLKKALV